MAKTTITVICPFCGDPAPVTVDTEHDAGGQPYEIYHAWCPSCGNDFNPDNVAGS